MKLNLSGTLLAVLSTVSAHAAVMAVGPGVFPPGSLLVNFNGLADGTEVNGLTVNGLLFNYTVGGSPLNGAVIIDGGPGITNNVAPPNIVSIGNNTGILTVTLPVFASAFGYGYAIANSVPIANATTISVFDGMTPLGSLSYNGVPDPGFAGGFAGIASTIQFNRVQITFNSAAAPAFALDNIRVNPIPEPSTVLLLLSGGVGALVYRRSRAWLIACFHP